MRASKRAKKNENKHDNDDDGIEKNSSLFPTLGFFACHRWVDRHERIEKLSFSRERLYIFKGKKREQQQ